MRESSMIFDDLFSGDDVRAEAAAQQITKLGKAAIKPLLDKLNAPNSEFRWWAVRALSNFDQPQAEEAICRALTDTDRYVRQCAALSLREHPTPAAIPTLIKTLEESDRLLARLAADALVAIGDLAITALTDALQSTNVNVRIEAARALARTRSEQAIPYLYVALDDPSPWVTYWAEEGLRDKGMEMLFFKT